MEEQTHQERKKAARRLSERLRRLRRLAGMAGLEPTISESKSGVLPLHYIPPSRYAKGRRRAGLTNIYGVGDGTRTHGIRNHNPALYQLSYTHHILLAPT